MASTSMSLVTCRGFAGLIADVYCGASDRNGVCCVCCAGSYRFPSISASMHSIAPEGSAPKSNPRFKIFTAFSSPLNVYPNAAHSHQ